MSEVKIAIKKDILTKFSKLQCDDCGTDEKLQARFEETEIILCKYCVQDRLDEIKEDETPSEIDTWENFVKEDHLNHWRKNA